MGVDPEVALKQASEKGEDARKLVTAGIDPSEHRKATNCEAVGSTFEAVARERRSKQVAVVRRTTCCGG